MAEKPTTTVQTILLSKSRFTTRQAAISWLERHEMEAEVVEGTTVWRARQRDPEDFVEGGMGRSSDGRPITFKTFRISDGVQAVNGRLKTGH